MTNRIRVAFFAEMLIDDFDGAARTMFQIIRRIPTDRYEFCFFCGVPPEGDFSHQVVKVPTLKIPKNEDYQMAVPLLAKSRLTKALRHFDPDVIHIATPSPLGNFAVKYAKKNNLPVLSIYHTHFISYIDYYLRSAKFLIGPVKNYVGGLNKKFYDKCDMVYVPSRAVVADLKKFDVQTSHFKLWRRGINTKLFNPSKKNESLVEDHHSRGKKVILFASRLVWEKNLQALIDVYEYAQKDNLPLQFVVAGDGVAMAECQEKMKDAIFTGMLSHEDLAKWYASADVFLFTSDTETYGNVVIEAMASGVPCVVADAGGPSDIVEQEVTGLKSPPHDIPSYVKNICRILDDNTFRNSLVSNGISYAQSLSWDALVDEYFTDITLLSNQKTDQ